MCDNVTDSLTDSLTVIVEKYYNRELWHTCEPCDMLSESLWQSGGETLPNQQKDKDEDKVKDKDKDKDI